MAILLDLCWQLFLITSAMAVISTVSPSQQRHRSLEQDSLIKFLGIPEDGEDVELAQSSSAEIPDYVRSLYEDEGYMVGRDMIWAVAVVSGEYICIPSILVDVV